MKFFSLHHRSPTVSFREAVIRGIAPDRGLYFPERIDRLPAKVFEDIEHYSDSELAYKAISQFVEEDIPANKLEEIVNDVLQFDFCSHL